MFRAFSNDVYRASMAVNSSLEGLTRHIRKALSSPTLSMGLMWGARISLLVFGFLYLVDGFPGFLTPSISILICCQFFAMHCYETLRLEKQREEEEYLSMKAVSDSLEARLKEYDQDHNIPEPLTELDVENGVINIRYMVPQAIDHITVNLTTEVHGDEEENDGGGQDNETPVPYEVSTEDEGHQDRWEYIEYE